VVPRAATEALGTAFLLMSVVGSGIMGERLAGGKVAIALLANAVATGAALVALILAFGPVSACTSIPRSRWLMRCKAESHGGRCPPTWLLK
jgi:glycerol uptake facilitator-like aquaporin